MGERIVRQQDVDDLKEDVRNLHKRIDRNSDQNREDFKELHAKTDTINTGLKNAGGNSDGSNTIKLLRVIIVVLLIFIGYLVGGSTLQDTKKAVEKTIDKANE